MAAHPWVAAGLERVRFGVLIDPRGGDWGRLREDAQHIEALGYDSLWMYDHPVSIGPADCWTALAYLAQATSTVRLGSAVSCVPYRHPAVLARMAADVDQLSEGRLVLGVGIGDDPSEFEQLGLPFGAPKDRLRALGEAVQVVRGLYSGEPLTFEGSVYQLTNAKLQSLPVQRPSVPIMIAGGGEKVTLRQVAEYGEVCNFGPYPWTGGAYDPADVTRKYAALRSHCEAVGRPYDEILRSYFTQLTVAPTTQGALDKRAAMPMIEEFRSGVVAGSPEEIIAHYQGLVDLGVQYFIAWTHSDDHETLRLLAREVVPALRVPAKVG